jgi:inner membrane protein
MDSLSQIVLGGVIAAACVPARHRRAALAAGAALGTLPDLDVIPLALLAVDPVQNMTLHRGLSHSLLVLPWLALALWWWFKGRGGRVAEAPGPWLAAIALALLTHPLLDAFTVYGTQLWWPLAPPPAMWSSVFIIDPAYTLPLLLAFAVALWRPQARAAGTALALGLALSTGYLGWSLAAKARVDAALDATLAGTGLEDAPRFSVPMPFQTLLWRVVVMTPEGFLEGERSVVADTGPIALRAIRDERAAYAAVRALPAVERLAWFNHGFMKASLRDGRVVLSDLRMGAEPDYSFNFAVADWDPATGTATAIVPEQLRWRLPGGGDGRTPLGERLRTVFGGLWARIWTQPPAGEGAGVATGAAPAPDAPAGADAAAPAR